MSETRRFSRSQRNALYIRTGGHCSLCGRLLDETWEADHVIPYTAVQETKLDNGQALCADCNRKKGARNMELRHFQEQFIQQALHKLQSNQPFLVANVHPGSGKTRGALLAANALIGTGEIEKVAGFVPRTNLCRQFELDTQAFKKWLPNNNLTSIAHRINKPPLFRDGAVGYVSTYASLIAGFDLHLEVFKKYQGRILLICDEAQQLGFDIDGTPTKSADYIQELIQYARLTIVMTGTPERMDGASILGAHYSAPNEDGYKFIEPDIEASYANGIRDGYLRRFDAELIDGEAIWQEMGYPTGERLVLSQMDKGIYRVIAHENYWKPMVDRLIEVTRESQTQIDPRLVGLISAYNQSQAREIANYIKSHHPQVKWLIAVSDDGEEATANLELFKSRDARYDVLITVNMAYVGYDHQPIANILPLTGYRSPGYLRQLFARGLRVMSDIPYEKQFCRLIVPDDVEMRAVIEMLRSEQRQGIKEREQANRANSSRSEDVQTPLGYAENAWVTTKHNRANDPLGDLYGTVRERVIQVLTEERISVPPATFYAAFKRLESMGGVSEPDPYRQVTAAPPMTVADREMTARRELKSLVGKCDHKLADGDFGTTNSRIIRKFNKAREAMTLAELQQVIVLVGHWMEIGRYD